MRRLTSFAALAWLSSALLVIAQQQGPEKKIDPKTLPKTDANKNPIR